MADASSPVGYLRLRNKRNAPGRLGRLPRLHAIRRPCSNTKMPVTDRVLVLNGAYFTNLLGDDACRRPVLLKTGLDAMQEEPL